LDVDKNHDLEKIEKFVKEKKEIFENVVILWIGWSALGTRAIMQALKWKYYNELSKEKRNDNPKLYILDNIDPIEINQILDLINLEKTLFVVISKSGSTLETKSQFRFFKDLVLKQGLDFKKHFAVVAWENSKFKDKCLKDWLEVFDLEDGIWGRFSAFTNVGLLPLAFVWIDIREILNWISDSKKSLLSDDIFENNALLTSIIQYHSYYELSKNITVFFPYISNFVWIWDWYKQMIAESLWKGWIGVTLTSAIWATDQHSQLQLYYDWPNDKLIIFLELENFPNDFNIWENPKFKFGELMKLEKSWTEESISSYNKINYTIKLDKLNEKSIWELIIMLEMQTAILWEFYNFNAFDQPWVEIGKSITKKMIKDNIWEINL
jgi:glucose-6-phosphate isomerase